MAVRHAGGQPESVCWYTADGFGAAMNAFAGQNYGVGMYERTRKGYKISFRIIAFRGCFVMMLFRCIPRQLSEVFFYKEEALRIAVNYLHILSAGEAFMSIELMTSIAKGITFTASFYRSHSRISMPSNRSL